ncbi:MAG: metalloregulator ArsR/SmtB family transcription factor [Chloroflexota bacterium]
METPRVGWDVGTGHDMFISLDVLHEPENFGLRGAWAAGVRSRLPQPEREAAQKLVAACPWPLHWVYQLPAPKDGTAVLEGLAKVPVADRLDLFTSSRFLSEDALDLLRNVSARRAWDEQDLKQLQSFVRHEAKGRKTRYTSKKRLGQMLNVWAEPLAFGEGILPALQTYHEVFFAEEEQRIASHLETAVSYAKELAPTLDLPDLLEQLSNGLRFAESLEMTELILAPSFWVTPLMLFIPVKPDREIFFFGARPTNVSLVPGDVVPDALFQALKAMADPTRLRILRYLAAEPMTPAELSRRLRLRAPTVIHHLHALRLARLVHLELNEDENSKKYAARREAVTAAFHMLESFLDR